MPWLLAVWGWKALTWTGQGWWAGHVAGPVAFVGREGELSWLVEALSGAARLVLVVGDAGVGKTRFAGEGMARAAAAGMLTVRGECLPLAGTLPLLPVAQALREVGEAKGGRLLEEALAASPAYVREDVGRLLPRVGPGGGPGATGRDEGWRRERLFSAVADLLDAVAGEAGAGLVVEDVHWADSATLDFLTFLARAGHRDGVTVVATCRTDQAPLVARVTDWLTYVRGAAGVEEIGLGPLSRPEVAEQVAALAGGPVPPGVVDEVFARAEGNPFFTEQLVAAALPGAPGGGLRVPVGLPARLTELLVARASRCGESGRAVLAGLAVAGRPLPEDLLSEITGLEPGEVRRGLRELAAARLLAEDTPGGGHKPRHALLAEAVAAALLPGERADLHEGTARALRGTGDQALAAETAGHWQAAGRPAEELPARVAAAEAAERVFGYAEAAGHWQRAIELGQGLPAAVEAAGIGLPRMFVRAIDALHASGGERAGELAEEAYRRYAGHEDPATAAVICARAAFFRAIEAPDAGLPLMKEALRLFGQSGPSAEHAEAWLDYAVNFLFHAEGSLQPAITALTTALEIAETAGATVMIPQILAVLAEHAFMRGRPGEGFASLRRARALAEASGDADSLLSQDVTESDVLLKTADFPQAADLALRGLQATRQTGWHSSVLAANAAEALLALGRTAEAAAVIDPRTTGPPDRDHWVVHASRAEIDLLRGEPGPAAERWHQLTAITSSLGSIDNAREAAQRAAELALWAGRPADALAEVQRAITLFQTPDLTIFCGRLLTTGMRACADLAGRARARRDQPALDAALAAASDLTAWVDQLARAPFTDHPFVATIPAERASWDAERIRLGGASDPAAWNAAAETWQNLGCPHRAGYAWWRHAEAQLDAGAAPAGGHYRAPGRDRGSSRARAAARQHPCPRRAGPDPPPGTASRLPRSAESPSGARAVPADRPGAGRLAPGGRRADQRPDRCRAVHQPQDRQRARDQHLPQARRLRPGPGRRRR